MNAGQSASVILSTGIKGGGRLWQGSHCYCGCKRSEGLRCWSRDIAETQRHPTMQNNQQNSYNVNAGYYINLLTIRSNLPSVFCVGIYALSVYKGYPPLLTMLRHSWFIIFLAFLFIIRCFTNVISVGVCLGDGCCDSDWHLTLELCFKRCFVFVWP